MAVPALVGMVVGLGLIATDDVRVVRTWAPLWRVWMTVGVGLSVVAAVVVAAGSHQRQLVARQRRELADRDWQTAEAVRGAVAAARHQLDSEARAKHLTFLSRLDHELKNPVTAIRAAAAAMRDVGVNTEPVAVIDAQSVRIATLVSDLRKLSDLETGPIEVAPVALAPLLADVAAVVRDELALQLQDRQIVVDLPTVPWRVPDVAGDVDLLFLAVYNLVTNSVKYSAPGGSITVRAWEDSGGVLLEVADTGQGIPADEVASVWDELQRCSNARGLPGSGLGLPLVRSIVERHGGRVQLSSILGAGTSVRVWLPLATAARRGY
ncbi:MAG: HAMP domain-containing histidine kinase [Micrococcales bacterium]|nr:HAMP domain-containing histidine kinase [Micrococcales bacterium]